MHPAHKRAIPIQLGKGDGPSISEFRVARLKAELDLSPQPLPPLPTESEELELIRRSKKGGRFHWSLRITSNGRTKTSHDAEGNSSRNSGAV